MRKDLRRARIQRITEELEGVVERLQAWQARYQGCPWDQDRPLPDELCLLLEDRDRLILRLAKAGCRDHPLVRERIATLRALGDRDALRRPRIGLEKGVKRPFSPKDVALMAAISRYREGGRSLGSIRGTLISLRRIRRMSRQGFYKLVSRLGLQGL